MDDRTKSPMKEHQQVECAKRLTYRLAVIVHNASETIPNIENTAQEIRDAVKGYIALLDSEAHLLGLHDIVMLAVDVLERAGLDLDSFNRVARMPGLVPDDAKWKFAVAGLSPQNCDHQC